ncbi:polyketide synthase dehydratase domain-containing protein, partial [Methylogaea oryzae]
LALPGCPDIRYETRLEPAHCAALCDHRVFGSLVVAGAYHLATVLEAASQALGTTNLRLEDIRLPRALAIPDGAGCRLQVLLEPSEGSGYSFRTLSCADGLDANDDAAWVTHVSGKLNTVGYAPRTAAPLGAQCAPYEEDGTDFYTRLSTIGFDLGPSYRWTQRIEQHDGQIRCRLQAPRQWDKQDAALHPGLLDTCFQILSRFWPATAEQMLASGTLYVPFAIAAVELRRFPGDASQTLLCRAFKETKDADNSELTVAAGLSLETENGEPLLRVEGFQFRRTGRDALLAGLRGQMNEVLELDWTPLEETAGPAPSTQQQWLILADKGGLGQALAERLQRLDHGCQVVAADEDLLQINAAEWDGVAYLRGLDNPEPSDATTLQTTLLANVAEVQTLLRRLAGAAPRLWLVTRGSQAVTETPSWASLAQAPLWGLFSVLASEHANLKPACIDLPPSATADDAAWLAEALLQAGREDWL